MVVLTSTVLRELRTLVLPHFLKLPGDEQFLRAAAHHRMRVLEGLAAADGGESDAGSMHTDGEQAEDAEDAEEVGTETERGMGGEQRCMQS